MTDTQTQSPDVEILDLPDPVTPVRAGNKTTYQPGVNNLVEVTTDDGRTVSSFVRFQQSRLIGLSGRLHVARSTKRRLIALREEIVLDGFEVGIINEDGSEELHPILTEERYRKWREADRPRRVNGSQFVTAENVDKIKDLVNYLYAEHGWSVIHKPKVRTDAQGNSRRKTTDLFSARPPRLAPNANPRQHGVVLDSFEVSVSADPTRNAAGMVSFYDGMEDQRKRWEDIANLSDAQERKESLEAMALNSHYVAGVRRNPADNTHYPRNVDVGVLGFDTKTFPLYDPRGAVLNDDLFAELFSEDDLNPVALELEG